MYSTTREPWDIYIWEQGDIGIYKDTKHHGIIKSEDIVGLGFRGKCLAFHAPYSSFTALFS